MTYMRYPQRSQQIREFVEAFIAENGYSPSVREIGAGVGLPSPGSIQPILKRMVEERILAGQPERPRTIRLGDAVIEPRTETM